MVTFVIPGFSPSNKTWLENTVRNLKADGEIRPVYWEHWSDPNMPFDPADKANEIVAVAMDDDINIVAKSIGTLVASYIIEKVPDKVRKAVFCGIPLNDLDASDKNKIKTVLLGLSKEKIVCFQNISDPHANAVQIKEFLVDANPGINLVLKDAGDHEYLYFTDFNQFLEN